MKRVLVFGDAIADVYSEYAFKKVCPDAPVNAHTLVRREVRAGGAANVAVNLAILSPGTQVDLISVFDTELGRAIKNASRARVNVSNCVLTEAVVRKERIYVDGKLQGRFDNMDRINDWSRELLTDRLDAYLHAHRPDLIVLSDYACGAAGIALGRLPMERTLVDTKEKDLSKFAGSLVIKLNKQELHSVLETESTPERFCQALVTTLGEGGVVLHMLRPHPHYKNTTVTHTLSANALTKRKDVVDVCGCGDTFLAGMAASLLLNDDFFTAVQFGNAAASTVVTQPRTAVADYEKTLHLIGRKDP